MRLMSSLLVASLLMACGGEEPPPPPKPKAPAAAEKPPEPPKPEKKAFADMSDEEKHAELMKVGEEVYLKSTLACVTCHQKDGKGTTGTFPPLVGDDAKAFMGDCDKHASIVLWGLQGEIEIDGVKYNGVMTPQEAMLDDMKIAAVMTYERNSWGNAHGDCTPDQVKAVRAKGKPAQ